MEGSSWILVAIVVGGVIMLMVENFRKRGSKWPPGPPKLPILGNLHQINKGGELIHLALAKLAKVHGGMMTVWFGSWKPMIVVSDPALAWEVLVTKSSDFSSRTLPYMSKIISADWHTIATSNFGPHWHALRKGLHNTTFNPQTIAAQARLQEHDLVNLTGSLQEEAASNHGVVKPLLHLRRASVRVIARFCFGFDFEDESFVEAMDSVVEEAIRLTSHSRLVNVFEFSRHIPILRRSYLEAYRVKHRIEELIGAQISSHRSAPTNCYLHFLLSHDFQEEVVIYNLFDLFFLGVDSTSTTIAWALAFLIHNPQIQHKLYEEVCRSGSKTITVEEVSKLRYLNAVVMETMRMKPIAPLGVPHKAARDSNIMGTKVLKGSPVMVNLYALLHDPSVWVEPHRFMPERFLTSSKNGNDDSSLVGAIERSFLPFGAGRRVCAGMELAKLEVGLTLAHLVNDFRWSSAVEGQLPDLTENVSIVISMETPLVARITPHHV
ncbi:hypothetical protein HHK36_008413 [Tetracentron sinense]|uniref:Cytochrome P450 n=1 Tax=Tetracentron sinense TaxID=13715 RepID=A0A834ZQ39_TETSI|nr:hypothetical protein HHK36_008413 [Tetracentron sinense]